MTLAELQQASARFKSASRLVESSRRQQYSAEREYNNLREKRLQKVLQEQGLAMCSEGQHHYAKKKLERLSLFPRDTMKLIYKTEDTTPRILLLCRADARGETNEVVPKKSDFNHPYVDITSEIVERDGRLHTVINNIDLGPKDKIEINYRFHFDELMEEIYNYFGMPALSKTQD